MMRERGDQPIGFSARDPSHPTLGALQRLHLRHPINPFPFVPRLVKKATERGEKAIDGVHARPALA
jgi:hypothetical protein